MSIVLLWNRYIHIALEPNSKRPLLLLFRLKFLKKNKDIDCQEETTSTLAEECEVQQCMLAWVTWHWLMLYLVSVASVHLPYSWVYKWGGTLKGCSFVVLWGVSDCETKVCEIS